MRHRLYCRSWLKKHFSKNSTFTEFLAQTSTSSSKTCSSAANRTVMVTASHVGNRCDHNYYKICRFLVILARRVIRRPSYSWGSPTRHHTRYYGLRFHIRHQQCVSVRLIIAYDITGIRGMLGRRGCRQMLLSVL